MYTVEWIFTVGRLLICIWKVPGFDSIGPPALLASSDITYFFIYLATLSVAQIVCHQMIEWLMNGEVERPLRYYIASCRNGQRKTRRMSGYLVFGLRFESETSPVWTNVTLSTKSFDFWLTYSWSLLSFHSTILFITLQYVIVAFYIPRNSSFAFTLTYNICFI